MNNGSVDVEDIVGPNIIAWGTHFFCKMPNDPKVVPWHQDASYWPLTPSKTVTVSGEAPDQETREKIVLCCGNVAGVDRVDDRMTVARNEPEAKFYTVAKGDTLAKIATEFYGDATKYTQIFEANKPMLKDPDKIYVGQVLRIPPKP